MIQTDSVQDQPLDLENWMARTETPAAIRQEIHRRLDDELRGGSPTGLRPARDADGQVTFVHPWIVLSPELNTAPRTHKSSNTTALQPGPDEPDGASGACGSVQSINARGLSPAAF